MREYQADSGYSRTEDVAADCEMLEKSGLFDRGFYRHQAGLDADSNAAEHYLLVGWQLGIEPSQNFEGGFLYPYFRSVGLDGPPALTFLTIQAAGWPVYPTRASVEAVATRIRGTEWFDRDSYSERADCGVFDPVLHYLIVGERIGHPPSDRFDPVYYRSRYEDIEKSGISSLGHFLRSGQASGRRPASVASQLPFDTSRLDPKRDTILLVLHQASRTDATVLAYDIAGQLSERYNVVALLLAGGELVGDFQRRCAAVIGPLTQTDGLEIEVEYLVKRLTPTYRILYAVLNGIDTRIMLKPLAYAMIPTVALVHEFSSYLTPKGEMGWYLEWANQIVFSGPSLAASAVSEYHYLENRDIHVLPPGPVATLPLEDGTRRDPQHDLIRPLLPPGAKSAFVVLGSGAISPEKGVDLFISCAAIVAALAAERPVRFVWIGSRTPEHRDFIARLPQQIRRSGLSGIVTIVDEAADLGLAYAEADLLLLSSRLDPLPLAAIGAALRGIPVVCFENTGGMADLLGANSETRIGVVAYEDVDAAAHVIAKLIADSSLRESLGVAVRRMAKDTFDMHRYVQQIDELGLDAAGMMNQRSQDLATIVDDPMFDTVNFLGAGIVPVTREQAIRLFLARAAAMGDGTMPASNYYYRRPCPGFHPQIYAFDNLARYDASKINPLAHFIRSGKPDGPWRHDVITPSGPMEGSSRLRVALHGHFFYPDLFDDCLQKMQSNRVQCDLYLSTTDELKADQLRRAATGYSRGKVEIRVVPNSGRDLGPFLTEFGEELAGGYDLIGHVHGKRSAHSADVAWGESWREFLWQNLLGDVFPMMDVIASRFSNDERLGIVFPDDPHLGEWDDNRAIAEEIAKRMGITDSLPRFFNYPIGTMFWARPKALAPLFSLRLRWEDYPDEPMGIDGTVLHAIERLMSFVARQGGYQHATTHIPGVTW